MESFRLRGMKLRDEFLCPITHELLHDPVVARDGHTYERSAIEKWLQMHSVSPRNGDEIDKTVIPNTNIKKIIADLISEGGRGLYTRDISDPTREIEVTKQKVVIMKCLGPVESEWNLQSFQVSHRGCRGGRLSATEGGSCGKESVVFKDITVSRSHFEIRYLEERDKYQIKDLGSVGGTFTRLLFGSSKVLEESDMVLIGKHQFIASFISAAEYSERSAKEPSQRSAKLSSKIAPADRAADQLLPLLREEPRSEGEGARTEITKRLTENRVGSVPSSGNVTPSKSADQQSPTHPPGTVCVFTCFAPEGSPLLHKQFYFPCVGGTIGRRASNAISLSTLVETDEENADEYTWDFNGHKLVSVDAAVSSVHATVRYDCNSGSLSDAYFHSAADNALDRYSLHDGHESKPSTNGTWIR